MPELAVELFDPRNGDTALKVEALDPRLYADGQPARSNYFTIFWIHAGRGTFWAEHGRHAFDAGTIAFLSPYQQFRLAAETPPAGLVIQFHANFFCMETHHEEVGCNGVLFNDEFGLPLVRLAADQARDFEQLVGNMRQELSEGGLAHPEMLVSYLKIFLVKATRLKLQQHAAISSHTAERRPPVLAELKQLIESHFRTLHRPSEYASRLHVAPKSLARLVKQHLHKTLTCFIRERVVREAKWELLHTARPVKEIAAGLGFDDVFYFSRLFKRATGCAPTTFREFESVIRSEAGRNPSIR